MALENPAPQTWLYKCCMGKDSASPTVTPIFLDLCEYGVFVNMWIPRAQLDLVNQYQDPQVILLCIQV